MGTHMAELSCDLASLCIQHDVFFSIENPGKSMLWSLWQVVALSEQSTVVSVDFDMCYFGGMTLKPTSVLTNSALPWTISDTQS